MAGRALNRVTVRLLHAGCRTMWGFEPRMIPHIVEAMGPGGALRWFAANMPRYLVTMQVLGGIRTHLAGMVISLYNGCHYCAYGHGYALELLYLRQKGKLFPLDVRTLDEWLEIGPRQLTGRMQAVLRDAGMHAEALWVDATVGLVSGQQQPVDGAEVRLAHLVSMFGTMNRIAVEAGCIDADQAQNPVNKDRAVKERHAALRAARV
ncbi:hypothetical protein GCM10009836_66280 [Pseudonocardia ailaonensis]|uniref:Carboxymuconolactone decarboxylase-like domain-containing protein n=1 Tax=Pseudonocardia ailaonensis TaxID=367279 RepID=A0ABN2NMF6_9PSEU